MGKNTRNDAILHWLNDAHALELHAAEAYENHAKDAHKSGYHELEHRMQQHLEETRRHAELVKGCIERMGGSVSKAKEAMGKITGFLGARGTGAADDEVVKNLLGDHAAEQFEIASYASLVAAARQVGDEETARVCEQILREEERMAEYLSKQIPTVTQQYLSLKA